MNKLIYIIAFLVPITILFIGIYTGSESVIYSGFSLLFFIFMSFIGSSIKEIRKEKIDFSKLKIVIPLFIFSIVSLLLSIYLEKMIVGAIISLALGTYSCTLLFRKKETLK